MLNVVSTWVECGAWYHLGGMWNVVPLGWNVERGTTWVECGAWYHLGGMWNVVPHEWNVERGITWVECGTWYLHGLNMERGIYMGGMLNVESTWMECGTTSLECGTWYHMGGVWNVVPHEWNVERGTTYVECGMWYHMSGMLNVVPHGWNVERGTTWVEWSTGLRSPRQRTVAVSCCLCLSFLCALYHSTQRIQLHVDQ